MLSLILSIWFLRVVIAEINPPQNPGSLWFFSLINCMKVSLMLDVSRSAFSYRMRQKFQCNELMRPWLLSSRLKQFWEFCIVDCTSQKMSWGITAIQRWSPWLGWLSRNCLRPNRFALWWTCSQRLWLISESPSWYDMLSGESIESSSISEYPKSSTCSSKLDSLPLQNEICSLFMFASQSQDPSSSSQEPSSPSSSDWFKSSIESSSLFELSL